MRAKRIRHKIPPFESLFTIENLYTAWHKVALGRFKKRPIQEFYFNLDKNLCSLVNDLREGLYKPGSYNRFLVYDPKERIIAAAPVRDRVVQHALINYYDHVFDRHLIYDSYACRVNKGTHKAILRAFHYAKGNKVSSNSRYFLKMDVRKYFDSIDHETLKSKLSKIILDTKILQLFELIIDSADGYSNKGIPIGNLTSQYFANFYLSSFDHYCKEFCKAGKYIRYMDDIIIFSNDKESIDYFHSKAVTYMEKHLKLTLKPKITGKMPGKGLPALRRKHLEFPARRRPERKYSPQGCL